MEGENQVESSKPQVEESVPVEDNSVEAAPEVQENKTEEITSPSTLNDETKNDENANNNAEPAQVVVEQPKTSTNPLSAVLQKCKEAIFRKKQKKLEKILEFARKHGKIKNDDVQKIILASDKTAERYLQELVKQGKLRKVGNTSQIYYELLN